jgi:type III pantothenate kinase
MNTLVIDQGNSKIKAAIFAEKKLIEKFYFNSMEEAWAIWREKNFDAVLISGVGSIASLHPLEDLGWDKVFFLNEKLPIPIPIQYDTKHTLGADRIAAAVGAKALFPKENLLVIDIGTCMTIDFVHRDMGFMGGSISPGLHMRLKSMHTFTARLPLISLDIKKMEEISHQGKSTESCMIAGSLWGMVGEIEKQMEWYSSKYSSVRPLICGGDIKIFESKIKEPIFAVPDLVLEGLNTILLYNVSID